jgi:hypothetical protein
MFIFSVVFNFLEFDHRAEKTKNVPEDFETAVHIFCNVQGQQKSGYVTRILYKEKSKPFDDATHYLAKDRTQRLRFDESWLWNSSEGIGCHLLKRLHEGRHVQKHQVGAGIFFQNAPDAQQLAFDKIRKQKFELVC